jgi:hypothetical protein
MNTAALSAKLPSEMKEIRTRPLFVFQIDVAPPSIIGMTPGYDRRIGEITGGTFEGERLRGKFRTGGSDWQSLRADGAISINVRLVMETDDGALIAMRYRGIRHGPKAVIDRLAKGEAVNPNEYYFRVTPWFETSSDKYDWLNRVIAVAIGHRLPSGPIYHVFEVV